MHGLTHFLNDPPASFYWGTFGALCAAWLAYTVAHVLISRGRILISTGVQLVLEIEVPPVFDWRFPPAPEESR